MPNTTNLNLPYPQASDTVDVPRDIQALASALDTKAVKVSAAASPPGSPAEGMLWYQTDTDLLQVYTGSAWRSFVAPTKTNGGILQMVQSVYQSGQYATSSATFVDTQLSASITPTSTSSKILVIFCHYGYTADAGSAIDLQLLRGSTVIANTGLYGNGNSANNDFGVHMVWLDSPSTTSATTYKSQFRKTGGTGAVYLGRNSAEETMTLIEVAA